MADIQTTLRLNDQASSVLQKVASTAKQVSSQMKTTGDAIDKAFTSNGPSDFAAQAGSAFGAVEGQATSLGMAVDQIFDGADAAGFAANAEAGFSSASAGADNLAGSAENAGAAIDEAASSAENLGASADGIGDGNGLDDLGNDAKGAGTEMDNTSQKAFSLGEAIKKMAMVIGAVKIANGFKQFVQDSIGLGEEYTHMMSEVSAISGATGEEYAMLQETAREYGASTVFTATQAAEALKYMSLAGWSASQSAQGLPGVLNLAAASGMELGAASDMVTDYLTAFGMEAGEATYMADMLSYAQSNSNTTTQQLGEAFLNSAAAMHSAGQDIETTTAFMEAMANQGTKGSRAGTQMAAVVRDITQKMKDYSTAEELAAASASGLTSVTGDMNDLLGTSAIQIGNMLVPVSDAKGNFRDLTDIMTDVETSLDGLGTAEASAALMDTFTDRSVRGVRQILTEGMDKVKEYEERLRHSQGAAERAAETMNDNLAGDKAKMTSALQEMQLQVFEGLEGTLRGGTQYMTNTIIPILTSWVPQAAQSAAEGIGKIGNALAPMLETILKNPQAVSTAFKSIGAGLLAFGSVNRISSVMNAFNNGTLTTSGGVIGAVAKFGQVLTAHPWAAGAAAVVGAITAIGLAYKHYNDMQVEKNLAETFGDIELSAAQISNLAQSTISTSWRVNIDSARTSFDTAAQMAEQAREALAQNDTIEWKARIGIELTEGDVNTYKENIQSYVESSIQAIESQSYAMSLTLKSMDIRMLDGSSFADQIDKWAVEDLDEARNISSQLTKVVEKALEDGVMDVNEQEAINRLQEKMNNILAGWKLAESKAKMDMLEDEYGRRSGKDLTPETFRELMEKTREVRQEALEAAKENRESLYMALEGAGNRPENQNNPQWDREYAHARGQITAAGLNEEAGALSSALELSNNTLNDTFGEQIEQSTQRSMSAIDRQLANMQSSFQNGSWENLWNIGDMIGNATAGNNAELANLWKVLQPDAQEAQGLMNQYKELGQEVPREFYDSYYQAMQAGAAAGDAGAAMELAARELVLDPSKDALQRAIMDGTANVPEDFRSAVERAVAADSRTDDPITFDGVRAEVNNMEAEFDEDKVNDIMEEGAKAAAEGAEPAEVEQEVNVHAAAGEMDMSGLEDSPEVAEAEPVDQEVPVNAVYEIASTDASQLGEAVSSALQTQQAANITVPANVTITAGTVNTEPAVTASQNAITQQFSNPFATDAPLDVTIHKESDNIDAVYSQVGSEIDSKFSSGYHTTAHLSVSITVDYSIANPTKTVTFGGAGSGSGTITAHALGGYFDSPHFGLIAEDGGEYIIPINGSNRSIEMWKEAGEMLGMNFGGANMLQDYLARSMVAGNNPFEGASLPSQGLPALGSGITAPVANASPAGSQAPSGANERTININIGSNGTLRFSGGVSKDEVVEMMLDNMKDVFIQIVEQEIVEEGEGVYTY